MLSKWRAIALVIALNGLVSAAALACGDEYSYCDDAWGGLYYTGGYDLYQFGIDIYTYSTYALDDPSYTSSWGGDCASLLSSCGGAWDVGNNSFFTGGYWGEGANSWLWPPLASFPTPSPPVYPPVLPPVTTPPSVFPPLPYTLPTPPVVGGVPRDPAQPFLSPPPSLPWGGCDGIVVPCPAGPITRTTPPASYFPPGPSLPPGSYLPPGGGSTPPPTIFVPPNTHNGSSGGGNRDQVNPTPPVRNQIPRG